MLLAWESAASTIKIIIDVSMILYNWTNWVEIKMRENDFRMTNCLLELFILVPLLVASENGKLN